MGLSVGLELQHRGLQVRVIERQHAMRGASWAAGGMLAARDPENPPALLPLALRSLELYPEYLRLLEQFSGHQVSFRTRRTLQQLRPGLANMELPPDLEDVKTYIPGLAAPQQHFFWLEEDSLDPRDLCRALPAAFLAAGGTLLEATSVIAIKPNGDGVTVQTEMGTMPADEFVNCCGAWAGVPHLGGMPGGTPVTPVKGQMVTVRMKPERLRCVLRTPEFYAIPRGDGRVSIGATIEHAGFDQSVQQESIDALLQIAAECLPEVTDAPRLEAWAGLRPGTPDELPIMGPAEFPHCWHATGHYRNGILLAPVTARVIAQQMLGEEPDLPLESFSPARFRSLPVSLHP